MATKPQGIEANANLEQAYQEALQRFGHRDNVTGIDIGPSYKDGKPTGKFAVRIHVEEKLPEHTLESSEVFPEQISGAPVDVIQARYKPGTALAPVAGTGLEPPIPSPEATSDRQIRRDPIQPGISVAHRDITAGTLGMVVVDNVSGGEAILSNWHVLAGSASAKPGDPITQPGSMDGGRVARDVVAALERTMLDSDGDAAIALLKGPRGRRHEFFETDFVPTGIRDPKKGEILTKSGRTTGVTRGRIEGAGRYFIRYSVGRVGVDGFRLNPVSAGNPTDEEISEGGDSGSIWYSEQTGDAVGLHFAGETDPRPGEEHAIACYVTRVFKRLRISLPQASGGRRQDQGDGRAARGNGASSGIPNSAVVPLLAADLGAVVASSFSSREVESMASHLLKRLPSEAHYAAGRASGAMEAADISPEIAPLGAVTIGFAAGAAARLIGKESAESQAAAAEAFPVVVAAFLAGAVVGAKAVDGKL